MLRLQAEREQKGWSRAELGRRSHLNPASVGLIERSRLVPYESQRKKLARALGLPASEAESLMEEVD